ncbi:ribosomal protein subunit L22 [Schizosaccharomyces cryophilus OY26]|uniref:Ribosomal protein subunit L22 n=1 Tax=Schizosaccharomyces cryophilus (strain OY26 / ATCC MYA-4695 / CBS 11777 / NBRC 106824 / NRRL Y48691) TaxID=653667 RepID=S9XBM8_SCHCR|nr:ribosomal protein subunit L22 [Schizosaccharomyces cryophilus OY26]EPY51211.1 ribosomal protein subunit L22 [Schizosaccharomyces cryophilus OY26]
MSMWTSSIHLPKFSNRFMGILGPHGNCSLRSSGILAFRPIRCFSQTPSPWNQDSDLLETGERTGSSIFSSLPNEFQAPSREPSQQKSRPWKRISTKRLLTMDPSYTHQSNILRSSLKKAGNLCRQIARKPFYHALLQMKFSEKRVSRSIASALVNARKNAVSKAGLDEKTLYIDQAWVGKATYIKKIITRGRGGHAVERRPRVRVTVLLKDERALLRDLQRRNDRTNSRRVWSPLPNRPIYNKLNAFTC